MPKREAPDVRVRNRGQVTSTLERYADAYRKRYPDRDVRWVYNPTHKPELSGILGRSAEGYRVVTWGELGMEIEGMKEDAIVQVADLALMSIDKATRAKLRADREQAAKDQLNLVKRKFYEEVDAEASAVKPSHHSRPPMRAVGEASIQEKEFEYNVEQRSHDR